MPLPPDIIATLERLGEDPAQYQPIADSQGLEFVRQLIERLTENASLFTQWYPRLKAFAGDKRRANPLPSERELGPTESAALRILQTLIRQAEHISVNSKLRAVIFSTPLYTLRMLQQEWPGKIATAVFLTPDERKEWLTLCGYPDDALLWLSFQWWDVEQCPPGHPFWHSTFAEQIEEGMHPLIIRSGVRWSEMEGSEKSEIWAWDSTREQSLGIEDSVTW